MSAAIRGGASRVITVVGGQYGSEGKGAIAAMLSRREQLNEASEFPLAAVRVAGPNAGHCVMDRTGRKWALRAIPVAAVSNPEARLFISAGSEIDEDVLESEITALDAAGFKVSRRLLVDGQATVIQPEDKEREALISSGTTGKGIGAARANRAMRAAPLWSHGGPVSEHAWQSGVNTGVILRGHLRGGGCVLVEGTQGYALGTHAGWYPYCTSSDCRAIDFLAMAGICPWSPEVNESEVWVCLRTYPIRIAGNSGPMVGETSWDELNTRTKGHIQPEYTTVTQKMRRVGEWDPELAAAAVEANGGERVHIALTFFDYWFPELAGADRYGQMDLQHWERIDKVEAETGAAVQYLGTGPDTGIWVR